MTFQFYFLTKLLLLGIDPPTSALPGRTVDCLIDVPFLKTECQQKDLLSRLGVALADGSHYGGLGSRLESM